MLYLLALLAIMPSAMAGPGKFSFSHLDTRKFRQITNWVINLFKIIFHNHENSHWIKNISYLIWVLNFWRNSKVVFNLRQFNPLKRVQNSKLASTYFSSLAGTSKVGILDFQINALENKQPRNFAVSQWENRENRGLGLIVSNTKVPGLVKKVYFTGTNPIHSHDKEKCRNNLK